MELAYSESRAPASGPGAFVFSNNYFRAHARTHRFMLALERSRPGCQHQQIFGSSGRRTFPQATRGPWRTLPIVRLGANRQLYFSKHAAVVFGENRIIIVEFDESLHTLKFIAVKEVPKGLVEDDCFHLTREGDKHGCSLAVRSLLGYIGFQCNGAGQELPIADMDHEHHSISIVLPIDQMADSEAYKKPNGQ